MKSGILNLRNQLAKLLGYVEKGGEIEIQRRNITIARIVPVKTPRANRTKPGIGLGTAKVLGNITDPAFSKSDWEMLK